MKKTHTIALVSLCTFLFAGCENVGPQARRDAALGAGVGAVAGGVAGSRSGDALEGAAIGAAAGGVAGGAYGHYRDRQNSRDTREATVTPITDFDGDGIVDTQDDFVDVDGDGVNDKAQLEADGYVMADE